MIWNTRWGFGKRKKYNNSSCSCLQKHLHDSRAEAGYCDELALMQRAGEIQSYAIQRLYPLDVNGHHICSHRVDFEVVNKEGKIEIHEWKGFETREWAIKKKLFEAIYPDIPYKVIR